MERSFNLRDGFMLGGWLVEPQLGRLTRDGDTAQLEPKIMEVLLLLAESRPRVVTKDTFFNTVWHDVNVIDHVLARAISEIRGALRDNPRDPKFIRTIPKIGYQLLAPVSEREVAAPASGRARKSAPLPAGRSRALGGNLAFFFAGILTVIIFLLSISMLVFANGGMHQHH